MLKKHTTTSRHVFIRQQCPRADHVTPNQTRPKRNETKRTKHQGLRAALSEVSSGKAADAERARQLKAERREIEERLEQTLEKVVALGASERLLKEELAEARRGEGAAETRLGESVIVSEVQAVYKYFGGIWFPVLFFLTLIL